jgi:hypothetical protein
MDPLMRREKWSLLRSFTLSWINGMGLWWLGGDFNLVRCQGGSNRSINFNHASLFNDWIDKWGLIDLKDPYRNYTWSNNQKSPIMARLDTVLVSVDWECKYPLDNVITLPRG